MANDPKTLLPGLLPQNPSSWNNQGQERFRVRQEQVDRVLAVFQQLVPSNYVSQVPGPYYLTQFQAMAERVADFQLTAQEVFADTFYDYTRAEVLFQILGGLVFPDAEKSGYPTIEGDLTYRTFLQRMVELLLKGATPEVQKEAVELLTDAAVTIIERGVEARKLKGQSAWGPEEAHTFEVNVENTVTREYAGTGAELLEPGSSPSDQGWDFQTEGMNQGQQASNGWLIYGPVDGLSWTQAYTVPGDTPSITTRVAVQPPVVDNRVLFEAGFILNGKAILFGVRQNNGQTQVYLSTIDEEPVYLNPVYFPSLFGPVREYTLTLNEEDEVQVLVDGNLVTAEPLASFSDVPLEDKVAFVVSGGGEYTGGSYSVLWSTFSVNGTASYTETQPAFPDNAIVLQQNVQLVLRALKPAHALYEYRNLFREAFANLFSDVLTWSMAVDHYQDMRRNWYGAQAIIGTAGVTWATDRSLFSDSTRDFTNIRPGAKLFVTSGANANPRNLEDNAYQVLNVLTFLQDDATPRAYTTSSSKSGLGTVVGSTFLDPTQEWTESLHGETLTIAGGPNAGTYRIKEVLGPNGGLAGELTLDLTTGYSCEEVRDELLNDPTISVLFDVAVEDGEILIRTHREGANFGLRMSSDGGNTAWDEDPAEGKLPFSGDEEFGTSGQPAELSTDGVLHVLDSLYETTLIIEYTTNTGATWTAYEHTFNHEARKASPGVRVAPSILQLRERMQTSTSGQSYVVGVDPSGVIVPTQISENVTVQFQGDTGTQDVVKVSYGPIAKGWGDGTAAYRGDVVVTADGVPQDIAEVNPYTGEIVLDTPLAFDTYANVTATYWWQPLPIHRMTLNTKGLTLNEWAIPPGEHHSAGSASNGQQIQTESHPKGAPSLNPFPMGIVLGPPERPQPVLIGHRYIGFEKAYSALLNSPTTFILNQNPTRSAIPGFVEATQGETVSWEATTTPSTDDKPWVLTGVNDGSLVGDGTYKITHAASEATPETPAVTLWARDTDFSFPATVYSAARFQMVEEETETNGFSGVGFGLHDNKHLYFVGVLNVEVGGNGPIKLVGLLKDPARMNTYEGWHVGPTVEGEVQVNRTQVSVQTSSLPAGVLRVGQRFVVPSGNQAGLFTIAAFVTTPATGKTLITVDQTFAANPKLYGNNPVAVLFETPWDAGASTYLLKFNPATSAVEVSVSGRVSATLFSGLASELELPAPATLPFQFDTTGKGQVFFGHVYPPVGSESIWSFVRYGIVPDQTALRGYVSSVSNDMTVLPEEAEGNEWFPPEQFGWGKIVDDELLLHAALPDGLFNARLGYERIEGFLKPGAITDLTTNLKGDIITQGYGGAEVVIRDTKREVRLSTLMFMEDFEESPFRRLVSSPASLFVGTYTPEDQNWTAQSNFSAEIQPVGSVFALTVSAAHDVGLYTKDLDSTDLPFTDPEVRIASLRMSFIDPVSPYAGFEISGPGFKLKAVSEDGLTLYDEEGNDQGNYDVDWSDEQPHEIMVIAVVGADTVLVKIDGELVDTLAVADFPTLDVGDSMTFGAFTPPTSSSGQVLIHSAAYAMGAPDDVVRTFGVWKGGDPSDIDNWELPRTDTTTAKNSEEDGPVIEDMDWLSMCELRVVLTDEWGVTVLRPDLSLPPYHVPESTTAGTGFTNNKVSPTEGWINVEYARLPRVRTLFGSVAFGPLTPGGIATEFWGPTSYTVSKTPLTDYKAPASMVLNQYNVITSGERQTEYKQESVTIPVIDSKTVSLIPTHLFASEIYKIVDGSTLFDRSMWTFDHQTQTVVLKSGYQFTSSEVVVMFIPGKPVTTTYLMNQPLLASVTALGFGTPPFPKSRMAAAQIAPDEPVMSENDVPVFVDDPATLYEGMEFMEVSNGGWERLVAIAGEGVRSPTSGWQATDGEPIYTFAGSGTPLPNAAGWSAGLKQSGTKTGGTQGASVMGLSGSKFNDRNNPPADAVKVLLDGELVLSTAGFFSGPLAGEHRKTMITNAILLPTLPARIS